MQSDTSRRPYSRGIIALSAALATARAERDSTSPCATSAWRTIDAHVRQVLPREDQADARQDALLALLCGLDSLRTTSPASAGAWVRSICRNAEVDGHRRARSSRRLPFDEQMYRYDAATTGGRSPEHAQLVLDAFMERVDARLAQKTHRHGVQRVQAVAALRRLALDESLPDIAAQLGVAVSPTLLTKWIERGRKVIFETVESEADRDLADFYEPFARLARERRADAGIPRPSRRKHNN